MKMRTLPARRRPHRAERPGRVERPGRGRALGTSHDLSRGGSLPARRVERRRVETNEYTHIGLSIPLLGIPLLGPQLIGLPLLAIDIRKNTVWEIERTVEWT
jgi:hypothetical protein